MNEAMSGWPSSRGPREPAFGGAAPWPAPLDKVAYQGLAGEVVRIIEPHTEADPIALLIQFLAAFGSCLGRGPYVGVEADRHYTNLFTVLVGQTSKGRKGTSWGRIRAVLERVDPAWARDRVHSGLSTGEGVIWAVRDAQGDDPGVGDKRLFVVESEFANVLRVMTREGNTLSRVIRDAWDRGDLATMTKTAQARATAALISIVGHITADELRRYLDRTEAANGFANRFVFLCVRRARVLPFGGSLRDTDLHALAERVSERLDAARHLTSVTWSPEARALWANVYEGLSEPRPGLLGEITGRAEAQVLRLALVYALADGSEQIGALHLQAALALWRYAEDSARYVFGAAVGDPVADDILGALATGPKTRTELRDLFGRHRKASQIESALTLLERSGRAERAMMETKGRHAEVWHLLTGA